MNLYAIDQAILNCIDLETGEIINAEQLNALQLEREKKLEGVALWIKNLKADATAYIAEKDAFAERQKAVEKKIDSLINWLAAALDGQKFQTTKTAVSFRKSECVEIIDESSIPVEFVKTKIEKSIDKRAIKDVIKQGQTVKGCQLVEKHNIQIK